MSMLNAATGWIVSKPSGQWLRIDLGAPKELVGVAIQHDDTDSGAYLTQFEVRCFHSEAEENGVDAKNAQGGNVFQVLTTEESPPPGGMHLVLFASSVVARVMYINLIEGGKHPIGLVQDWHQVVDPWVPANIFYRNPRTDAIIWEKPAGLRAGVLTGAPGPNWNTPGKLSAGQCDGMLRDSKHLFRRMWAQESYSKQTTSTPKCWDRVRDKSTTPQSPSAFFTSVLNGSLCRSNWYEGNVGNFGVPGRLVDYGVNDAFPLLGFDEAIDTYCLARVAHGYERDYRHAERCVAAKLNILNIFGERLPYNLCRNLEWQMCAARGLLPGQRSLAMRFATAPSTLDVSGTKPLGQCHGWKPYKKPSTGYGYATDDIFFLETCLFNQVCTNGADLFNLQVGQAFVCDFSHARFKELQDLLLSAPDESAGSDHAVFGKSEC